MGERRDFLLVKLTDTEEQRTTSTSRLVQKIVLVALTRSDQTGLRLHCCSFTARSHGKSLVAVTSVWACEMMEQEAWAFAALLHVLQPVGDNVGRVLKPYPDIRRALVAGCVNRCRETSLAGLGAQHTPRTSPSLDVIQVSCFNAATRTVTYKPLALTKRHCSMRWSEDKRWKPLFDASLQREAVDQIVLTNSIFHLPFGTSAEKT